MCKHGTLVEVIIDGEKRKIDSCIAPLIQALNDKGIKTLNSCCGHSTTAMDIIIDPDNVRIWWVEGVMRISLISWKQWRENQPPV